MFRPILPEWDSSYPDPVRLRREVDAMVDSFVEALLGEMPNEALQGIYLKGSAHKEWDSPIDYVPEISDVDIHIQFYNDEAWRSHIGTFAQAMKIHREVERAYLSKIREPLHTPRPQLIVVNKMVRELEFVHAPRETVRALYGEEYPLADYSDPDSIRRVEWYDYQDWGEGGPVQFLHSRGIESVSEPDATPSRKSYFEGCGCVHSHWRVESETEESEED